MQGGTVKTLKITIVGCSTGAEAYSIASVLRERHPNLDFTVCAYDIDSECIKIAKNARYTHQQVFSNEKTTANFINTTFDVEEGFHTVKSDIRKHVHFDLADALNTNLKEQIGTSDIVYAQHVLMHMKSQNAKKAFKNIYRLLNPKSALFIAGINLDVLQKLTRKNNLMPCGYKVEQIHNEVKSYSPGWPYVYHSVEPFMAVRKDWHRRYSTIFFKNDADHI